MLRQAPDAAPQDRHGAGIDGDGRDGAVRVGDAQRRGVGFRQAEGGNVRGVFGPEEVDVDSLGGLEAVDAKAKASRMVRSYRLYTASSAKALNATTFGARKLAIPSTWPSRGAPGSSGTMATARSPSSRARFRRPVDSSAAVKLP